MKKNICSSLKLFLVVLSKLFCRHQHTRRSEKRKVYIRGEKPRINWIFRQNYAYFVSRFVVICRSSTMHTVLTRGNAILAYTLSVLACLTFCCFISTVFLDYRTNVKINTVKTLVKNVPNYGASKELHDLGFITFDLQTDLSGLFNWNVKQLFLYLTAEYKTEANELNQVR